MIHLNGTTIVYLLGVIEALIVALCVMHATNDDRRIRELKEEVERLRDRAHSGEASDGEIRNVVQKIAERVGVDVGIL